mgnify:CR=1 FL=1
MKRIIVPIIVVLGLLLAILSGCEESLTEDDYKSVISRHYSSVHSGSVTEYSSFRIDVNGCASATVYYDVGGAAVGMIIHQTGNISIDKDLNVTSCSSCRVASLFDSLYNWEYEEDKQITNPPTAENYITQAEAGGDIEAGASQEPSSITMYIEQSEYSICEVCHAVYRIADQHCWNCAGERAGLGVQCENCGGYSSITDVRHAYCDYCGALMCHMKHCINCGACLGAFDSEQTLCAQCAGE